MADSSYSELRGNLHIHTTLSDGTLPLASITSLAKKLGLDYIGINDHFAPCRPAFYQNGLLVLAGTELNREHSHYLAYGAAFTPSREQMDGAAHAAHVKGLGGLGIIAHPFERGSPLVSGGKCYPWLNWETEDFQGIEIWNLTSQWRDSAQRFWPSLFRLLFDRHRPFARGACPQSLAKWDALCQKRHISAVAGSDLHAPRYKLWGLSFKILNYPLLLAAVNTYCRARLTGNGEEDGQAVIAALRRGRCWIVYDRLGQGRGFSFCAWAGEQRALMGDKINRVGGKVRLTVRLPRQGTIQLFRNGVKAAAESGGSAEFGADAPGAYRVEVWLGRMPWLYSNPIYVL